MNKEMVQITFDCLDILSTQLSIEDTIHFLENAQKLLQTKIKITKEDQVWLVDNLNVSIRHLEQELQALKENGKFVFAPKS